MAAHFLGDSVGSVEGVYAALKGESVDTSLFEDVCVALSLMDVMHSVASTNVSTTHLRFECCWTRGDAPNDPDAPRAD